MHEVILNLFNGIKSFCHFLKIVCTFCIIMLLFLWVQNLTNAHWEWLGFITPFLNAIINAADSVCSLSFNLFGATFELKYLGAIIILIALGFFAHFLIMVTCIVEAAYKGTHKFCKKTEEVIFNHSLQQNIASQEKKLKKFKVGIHTSIKPKFSRKELNVNLDEQNELMINFISDTLAIKPKVTFEGFIYEFDDFNNVDSIVEVLFRVLHSRAPLDYAICIQIGEDIKQLNKLLSLNYTGKIIMAADTAFRYNYNKTQKYSISQVGIFQYENRTIEVMQFDDDAESPYNF